MANSKAFNEKLRNMLAEARAELVKVEAEKKDWETAIASLTKEIESLQTILESYGRRVSVKGEPDWKQLLKGKKHAEKLVAIAQHTGDSIRVNRITDILVTAGLVKSKSRANAYRSIRGTIEQLVTDKVFEKVSRGQYRLVGSLPRKRRGRKARAEAAAPALAHRVRRSRDGATKLTGKERVIVAAGASAPEAEKA
ncbi:MAG: hypothetical protein HY665_01620 [Chloroflexi bacterium]|nr:hypothetical protein [Chloroflexota bacterium]